MSSEFEFEHPIVYHSPAPFFVVCDFVPHCYSLCLYPPHYFIPLSCLMVAACAIYELLRNSSLQYLARSEPQSIMLHSAWPRMCAEGSKVFIYVNV
jgi:hypothetical protein